VKVLFLQIKILINSRATSNILEKRTFEKIIICLHFLWKRKMMCVSKMFIFEKDQKCKRIIYVYSCTNNRVM